MTFSGTWYKNGPLRLKNKHPFVGTGNVVRLKFEKGIVSEMEQKKILLPRYQKYLPQIDQNGISFRNEGNLSIQYMNHELYAMAEMMPPYVLNPDTLDTKYIKPSIPSGIHPKVINNTMWNCYLYGKYMILLKQFKHFKTIEFTQNYYVHDFFINEECLIAILNPYEFDCTKAPLEGMDFSGNSQLFIYYFSKDVHVQYPLPEQISKYTITHIGNVIKESSNLKIQCFGIAKGSFNFKDVKPNQYMSTPLELTVNDSQVKLSQYWTYINGDMPVRFEDKIAFVSTDTVFLWEPSTWTIIRFVFPKSILEEPIWTNSGELLVLAHGDKDSKTKIHTFDTKLNLLNSQAIPKVNMSFHGVWVEDYLKKESYNP